MIILLTRNDLTEAGQKQLNIALNEVQIPAEIKPSLGVSFLIDGEEIGLAEDNEVMVIKTSRGDLVPGKVVNLLNFITIL